jgi:hypothetical protein
MDGRESKLNGCHKVFLGKTCKLRRREKKKRKKKKKQLTSNPQGLQYMHHLKR